MKKKPAKSSRPDPMELQKRVWILETQLSAAMDALKLIGPRHLPGTLSPKGRQRTGLRRASCPVSGGRTGAAVEFIGCAAMIGRLERQLELFTKEGGNTP